jgi:ribosomal-protein-alanine N-acetyltransferase
MYGPVIEGKLVRFRPPKVEDAAEMITWFEDMEVTRFILRHHPPSLEEEKEWIEKMGREPEHIVWVLEHKGRVVGSTAIHAIDWKNGFGTTGTVIGDKTVWRKGLGSEVMQLRTRYAFTQLPLRKLKSAHFEGNEASARAQAAAGYREIGRYKAEMFIDGHWRDEILSEVNREDWLRDNSV